MGMRLETLIVRAGGLAGAVISDTGSIPRSERGSAKRTDDDVTSDLREPHYNALLPLFTVTVCCYELLLSSPCASSVRRKRGSPPA